MHNQSFPTLNPSMTYIWRCSRITANDNNPDHGTVQHSSLLQTTDSPGMHLTIFQVFPLPTLLLLVVVLLSLSLSTASAAAANNLAFSSLTHTHFSSHILKKITISCLSSCRRLRIPHIRMEPSSKPEIRLQISSKWKFTPSESLEDEKRSLDESIRVNKRILRAHSSFNAEFSTRAAELEDMVLEQQHIRKQISLQDFNGPKLKLHGKIHMQQRQFSKNKHADDGKEDLSPKNGRLISSTIKRFFGSGKLVIVPDVPGRPSILDICAQIRSECRECELRIID